MQSSSRIASVAAAGSDAPPAPMTIDELLPHKFGLYGVFLSAACSSCYSLGGIAAGLAIFLVPRLEAANWTITTVERSLVSSLLFVGNFGGLLMFGAVADRYGRIVGVRCGIVLLAASLAATFLSASAAALLAARVLTGVSQGALMGSSFVLLAELTAQRNRVLAKALQECGFSLGLAWLAAAAYVTRDGPWQALSLAFLPALLALCAAFALPESPRCARAHAHRLSHRVARRTTPTTNVCRLASARTPRAQSDLLARGDEDGARRVLRRIGRRAGCPLPSQVTLQGAAVAAAAEDDEMSGADLREGGASRTCLAASRWLMATAVTGARLFRQLWQPSLRRKTALVSVAWFGSTLVYYGILFSPVTLSSNFYAQQALGAFIEMPGYLVMLFLGDRLGRARTWSLLNALGALALLALGFLPATDAPATDSTAANSTATPSVILLPVALSGRLCAAGATTICYVAAAEQFPTTCRSLGVGFGASCGRLGCIIAPFIPLLPHPQIILAAVAAAAAVCGALLPETKGTSMSDVQAEAQGGGEASSEQFDAPSPAYGGEVRVAEEPL